MYYTLLSSNDQTLNLRLQSLVVKICLADGAHLAEQRPAMPWSIFDDQEGSKSERTKASPRLLIDTRTNLLSGDHSISETISRKVHVGAGRSVAVSNT